MIENDDNDPTDDVETLVLAREGGVLVRRRHAAPREATTGNPVPERAPPRVDAER